MAEVEEEEVTEEMDGSGWVELREVLDAFFSSMEGERSDSRALGSWSAIVRPIEGMCLTLLYSPANVRRCGKENEIFETNLVLPDRLSDLVRDLIEHPYVIVRDE